MTTQSAEIKSCLRNCLGELMDKPLENYGFVRRKMSKIYERRINGNLQKIEVGLEFRPSDRPDSVAAIYPIFTIEMPGVNMIVRKLVGGQTQLGGDFSKTLHGPVEWTSPKGNSARWYIFQVESVSENVSLATEFLLKWTIPFLNKYKGPVDLCGAPLEGDERIAHTQMEILRVVAANLIIGNFLEARRIMENWFGKPGPRKKYKKVFDYLNDGHGSFNK